MEILLAFESVCSTGGNYINFNSIHVPWKHAYHDRQCHCIDAAGLESKKTASQHSEVLTERTLTM